jgi:hypothetical protein
MTTLQTAGAGMDMLPGVKVDREILQTLSLPKSKRKAAQAAIKTKRNPS